MNIPQYTSRVGLRAELARLIRTSHLAAAEAHGLSKADLETIEEQGEKAREADRLQHEEIAMNATRRNARAKTADHLLAEDEGKIRDRMPLVIADLGDSELATFLKRLSFARYRIREHAPATAAPSPAPAPAAPAPGAAPAAPPPTTDDDEVRSVQRVEKQDMLSRIEGLAALCAALLRPGREKIVAAFEARKLTKAEIAEIAAEAEAFVKAGKNTPTAATAAETEAAAVRAQRAKWAEARRAIKKVVAGHGELARLFAEC